MGAASLARGEALVNAIAVGLVGDDENAAVRPCGGSRAESQTCQKHGGQKNGDNAHAVPEKWEAVDLAGHDEPPRCRGEMRRLWGVALTLHPGCSMVPE
mgnify:CR=1 FL=1